MNVYRMGKEMALLAALRATVYAMGVIGRQLALNDAEREVVATRVKAAMFSQPAAA